MLSTVLLYSHSTRADRRRGRSRGLIARRREGPTPLLDSDAAVAIEVVEAAGSEPPLGESHRCDF